MHGQQNIKIYYNVEWFPIFSVVDYFILCILVKLPRWWSQKRLKHVGN